MAHIGKMTVKVIREAVLNGPIKVRAETGSHIIVHDGNARPRLVAANHGVIHFDVPSLGVPRPLPGSEGDGVVSSGNKTRDSLRKSSRSLKKRCLLALRRIRIPKGAAIAAETRSGRVGTITTESPRTTGRIILMFARTKTRRLKAKVWNRHGCSSR